MLLKLVQWFYNSRFKPKSVKTMAMNSSIGVFIGILPLFGIRIPIVLALSIVFPFHLPSLLFGVFVPFILPFLYQLSFLVGQKIAGFDIPYVSLHYLSFTHLLQWSTGAKYHLIGSIVVGLFLSLLFHPIFRKIYHLPIIQNKIAQKSFVFLDQSKKRWSLTKKIIVVFLGISLVVVAVFGMSISIHPFLPDLGLKNSLKFQGLMPITQQLGEKTLTRELKKEYNGKNIPGIREQQSSNMQNVLAFYVSWDDKSKISLRENIGSIQVLIPDWYQLNKDLTVKKQMDENIDFLAQSHQVKVMPLINNYVNDKWDPVIVHQLLINPTAQEKMIQDLLAQAKARHYYGINIDFESLQTGDQKMYSAFIEKLSAEYHKQGLKVTVDVPPNDGTASPYDYQVLAKVADQLIIMVYDEHSDGGDPGPVASLKFTQESITSVNIPKEKLIVSLGNYGYDWVDNSNQAPNEVSYSDVLSMAANGKLNIYWNKESGNPYTRYRQGNQDHTIWFLDGSAFYNELKDTMNDGVYGVALWRLGSEDPTVWKVLKNANQVSLASDTLSTLDSPDPVNYSGEGEILKIISIAQQGKRAITFDQKGMVTGESYLSFPTPFAIERYGKPKGKEVVLTFDDGPDPNYTPKILDILSKYHVPASFFVVGQNAAVNPDLVERMYREGHEIGNHTFTHPNVGTVSPLQTNMELNATQRLIQELTGHSTVLFRAPYVADAEPSSPNELLPILRAQETGYTMVGEMIDPQDWSQPPSTEIVKRINDQLKNGNIILLHDAGGDRTHTVEALPYIIESLKSEGYTFVTVSHLLGKSRDTVMPSLNSRDNPFMLYDRVVFTFLYGLENFITYLFYTAIVLGVIRLLFLGYNGYRQKKRKSGLRSDADYKPAVSVVLAAYNEEKVIGKTVHSILASDYANFEIIVVDDGSTDGTAKVIQEEFGEDPRVRFVSKRNGGKSSAINCGILESQGEIIVALDADTLIKKDAISLLIPHFIDSQVAAVSGNIKVGNIHNLLTNWQHIEYVTGFNLERRAFSMFNCITVVPGAIGAWRKEVVIQCGLFKEDTLAEDTDLTLQLLKEGYRVEFEEYAYAYTEAPDDLKGLLKQRFRWTYGTLQCLWKYRDQLFHPKRKALGFIALPNMWLFQFIFQSLSPIADIYFIMGLFGTHPGKIVIFYLLFYLVDLLASIFAFKLEGEKLKPLFWVFLQRILYRQIMSLVVLKALIAAIKGITVGWNKLKRQGNVAVPTTDKGAL